MSTTELVRVEPLLPLEPEQARQAMAQYHALTEAMLTTDDWQQIPNGGKFVKRSGWRKIATGYGLSVELVSEDIVRDDNGNALRARVRVLATHPNGRRVEGIGGSSITEASFNTPSKRSKAEHDIAATAFTRAANRAISDLVGFGAVSAEEIDGNAPAAAAASSGYGQLGTAADDEKAAEAVEHLFSNVPGDQFIGLVCKQLGVEHLPVASTRMVHALAWAHGNESNKPPDIDGTTSGGQAA